MKLTIAKNDKNFVSLEDDGLLTVYYDVTKENPHVDEKGNYRFPADELEIGEGIAALYGFACCGGLRRVVLPDTMLALKGDAFCYCNELEELVVPAAMSALNELALLECSHVKRVIVRDDAYYGFYDDEPPVVFALRHTMWGQKNHNRDVVVISEDGKRTWKL